MPRRGGQRLGNNAIVPKAKQGGSESRSYCFTLNNYINDQIDFAVCAHVRYAIWQAEVGATGTPHLQGYIEFDKPVSMLAVKRIVGARAHVEPRAATRDEAREYCQKSKTKVAGPWEYGTWITGPGHRTDRCALQELLESGATEEEISKNHFKLWKQFYRAIQRFILLHGKKRTVRTCFHVVVGDSGAGKSWSVRDAAGEGYFDKGPGTWWCTFNGTSPVVMEEIDQLAIPIRDMIHLADRGHKQVEPKGNAIHFNSPVIYATSNEEVHQWYRKAKPLWRQAFYRRIDSITTFRFVEIGGYRVVKTHCVIYPVETGAALPVPPPPIKHLDPIALPMPPGVFGPVPPPPVLDMAELHTVEYAMETYQPPPRPSKPKAKGKKRCCNCKCVH